MVCCRVYHNIIIGHEPSNKALKVLLQDGLFMNFMFHNKTSYCVKMNWKTIQTPQLQKVKLFLNISCIINYVRQEGYKKNIKRRNERRLLQGCANKIILVQRINSQSISFFITKSQSGDTEREEKTLLMMEISMAQMTYQQTLSAPSRMSVKAMMSFCFAVHFERHRLNQIFKIFHYEKSLAMENYIFFKDTVNLKQLATLCEYVIHNFPDILFI